MAHKTLKSDRLWKFSSAGRASALQAEGQRFEPVNFHQTSTCESKCFFFSLLQPDSSSANRQRVTGLSPVTHTNKRNPNLLPNGDGFGFTVIFMEKSKTEKPGGLLAVAILPVFYANALSEAAFPAFRSANALFIRSPTFRFYSLRLLRDSSSNR